MSKEQEKADKQHFHHHEYTPELWAAKFAHLILCGDFRNHVYEDKDFEKWIHELFRILHTEDVQVIRQRLLPKDEIIRIEAEMEDY